MRQITDLIKKLVTIPEIRRKLLFTLGIFGIYRLLAHVPVPGVNVNSIANLFSGNQFLSFVNIFSGGTLANFSIAAIGISPFITASIIMQLAAMVIPSLKELQKDGESGREKVNQYTRLLSVPMAVVQSISILALLNSQGLLYNPTPLEIVAMIMSLIAGALIVMWLGELVSIYGLGNGISMVLLAGIVSQFPLTLAQVISTASADQFLTYLAFTAVFLSVIGSVVFMNEAIRKVPIQYAKRVRGNQQMGGAQSHLPIRVNVAGVMPIIFAVSIMLAPPFIGGILTSTGNTDLVRVGQQITAIFNQTSLAYMVTYFVVVFAFTYFSAMIFFNTEDISDELKKSGAFIQGVRPGGPTKKYLDYVVSRITLAGAVFLGSIAVLPSIAQNITGVASLAVGGTSLLIVVSVILETSKQIDSMMIGENYEQFT